MARSKPSGIDSGSGEDEGTSRWEPVFGGKVLFYLAHPDAMSRTLIREGHGHLWVFIRREYNGGLFKSLATGRIGYFGFPEMEVAELDP
jgi:hypothetical protein